MLLFRRLSAQVSILCLKLMQSSLAVFLTEQQEELADTADITDMADTTTDTATDIPTATVILQNTVIQVKRRAKSNIKNIMIRGDNYEKAG